MKDRDWYDAEKVKKASVKDCIKQLESRDLCDFCMIALGRLEELIKLRSRFTKEDIDASIRLEDFEEEDPI